MFLRALPNLRPEQSYISPRTPVCASGELSRTHPLRSADLSPKLRPTVTFLSPAIFAVGLTAGLIVAGVVWAFSRGLLSQRLTELAARDAALGATRQELSAAM